MSPISRGIIHSRPLDLNAVFHQFRAALEARGIAAPDEIIADGEFHRLDAIGRKGKRGASYRLHLDGVPAGGFRNWHDGIGWQNWKADVADTRSSEERARFSAEVAERKTQRNEEMRKRRRAASTRADWIWYWSEAASPAHPYLLRKRVPSIGLGLYKGALVLPMRDIGGQIHNVQLINEDGRKTFLKFGRVEGCFFTLGTLGELVLVVEGYATAASIHLATGLGVVVAFSSGNLLPVTLALREQYPARRIVICADDDVLNTLRDPPLPNAGMLAAYRAARAAGATVAVPVFPSCAPEGKNPAGQFRAAAFRPVAASRSLDPRERLYRPGILPQIDCFVHEQLGLSSADELAWGTVIQRLQDVGLLASETDFNDLHLVAGLESVARCIERATPPPAEEVEELCFEIAV